MIYVDWLERLCYVYIFKIDMGKILEDIINEDILKIVYWGVIFSKYYFINLIIGYEMGRVDYVNMFVSIVKDLLVDNYFK